MYPENNVQKTTAPASDLLLGRGVRFEGKLTFAGTVRIDASFVGTIVTDDMLVVGEAARIDANITCGTIVVHGEVNGNIQAKAGVEIRAAAKVRGDLETPSLVVEKGALFQGASRMDSAAKAARDMAIGLVYDLAVGVDPGGADSWMLQDVLAQGVRVGAPPDAFNQRGQDWGLAAWRPDRLAATGYRAYRDLLAATFKHANGVRVDHVAGLWRLWWIPPGASADQGTYVRYDADAMLGALTVEAHQTGAVVVGEDLGTVPPKVTRGIHDRNILGSTVLWFTRDWRKPGAPFRRPKKWPELALASVSTHDLPTVQGFLTGTHVRLRAEAGVLTRDVADEQAAASADVAALEALLGKEGLADEDPFPYSDSLHLDFLQRFGREDVQAVLASLPEHYRAPLLLVYVDGFLAKEAALMLKAPLGTILARLHRGRKLFERRLWEYAEANDMLREPVT